MFVNFEEYLDWDYDLLSEKSFKRFVYKAGNFVETRTLGRVTDEFLNPSLDTELTEEESRLIERNKRGICEIADILYQASLQTIGESGSVLTSFSNSGYSESYSNLNTADAREVLEQKLSEIMSVYFTSEQLSRLVIA